MNQDNKFEKLEVWKQSHQLVLAIYKVTKTFPGEEKYALIDQLRRSASSIPTNIVEGNERQTKKEYLQFLYTAKGSVAETKYHLLLAKDLGYLPLNSYNELTTLASNISKMITALIRYLKSDI